MVIKGDVTNGAIVSSVIVLVVFSGIISNFSLTLILFYQQKTGKDPLLMRRSAQKTIGITVNIKVHGDILSGA